MQQIHFSSSTFTSYLRIDAENKRYSFLRGTATAIDLHPAGEDPSTRRTHTPKSHVRPPFTRHHRIGPDSTIPEYTSSQAILTLELTMGSLCTLPSNTYPNSTLPSSSPEKRWRTVQDYDNQVTSISQFPFKGMHLVLLNACSYRAKSRIGP